ncbi:MAG TPA: hypothetical protein VFX58_16780 [Chitinophagaceae bacterium]|nr:hypothetical protein [Chitinophagaceae bacterium]
MISNWINILKKRFRQAKARRQLRMQELLKKTGIGFRTEVLDIKQEGDPLLDYVPCSILANLRIRGKIVCCRVHTLLKGENLLRKGDPVLIRYRPGHLSQVLVNR